MTFCFPLMLPTVLEWFVHDSTHWNELTKHILLIVNVKHLVPI